MFKQFMHNFPLQQINHDKNLVEKDTKFKKLNKCQKSPAEQDKILTFHNSPSPSPPPPPPLSLSGFVGGEQVHSHIGHMLKKKRIEFHQVLFIKQDHT